MPRHFLENLAALFFVRDLPCRRGEISARAAFDMEREFRICVQVGEPAASPPGRLAADVEPATDVVQHDLDAPLLPALPAAGRDVDDRHRPGQGVANLIVERLTNCHSFFIRRKYIRLLWRISNWRLPLGSGSTSGDGALVVRKVTRDDRELELPENRLLRFAVGEESETVPDQFLGRAAPPPPVKLGGRDLYRVVGDGSAVNHVDLAPVPVSGCRAMDVETQHG